MAQRFTFSGHRLVQLDRQALFCDLELLDEQARIARSTRDGSAPFLMLRRVEDPEDLPPDDPYGLEYTFVDGTDSPTNNPSSLRVLYRVAPFIDRRVVAAQGVHASHQALLRDNLGQQEALAALSDENFYAPLRVMWSDCWRVCAAWWGVSTDIVERTLRRNSDSSGARLTTPCVHALVKDPSTQGDIDVEAGPEYGPNVAQRLTLAILRKFSGLSRDLPSSNGDAETTVEVKPPLETKSANAPHNSLAAALRSKGEKLKHVTPRVRTMGCVDAGRKGERRFLEADQWLWDAFAKTSFEHNDGPVPWLATHGLSESVVPHTNDGLVTVPLMGAQQWSRSVICQYNPNFHFSVVVLCNEADHVFVTLENWAVADPLTINDQWGFCVWSLPGSSTRVKDTFHERLTNSGGYGSVAVTFRVRPT